MAYQERKAIRQTSWTQPRTPLGIYETTITTLQELATFARNDWGGHSELLSGFVGKSKQNRALAITLHAKTEEHFAIKDSSWFDVHEVLTDYAARGCGDETP